MSIQHATDPTHNDPIDNIFNDAEETDIDTEKSNSALKKIEQYWEEKELKKLLEDELFHP